MDNLDIIIHINDPPITSIVPANSPKIDVINAADLTTVYLQENIGSLPFPAQERIKQPTSDGLYSATGIVVLPVEGGGRGPTITSGEEITTGMLLGLLNSSLSENEFNQDVNDTLDIIYSNQTIIASLNTTTNQHSEDIALILEDLATTPTDGTIENLTNELDETTNTANTALAATVVNTAQISVLSSSQDQNILDIEDNTGAVASLASTVSTNSSLYENLAIEVSSQTTAISTNTSDVANINSILGIVGTSTNKDQSGYATDGDIILLDFTWPSRTPLIDLIHSHGLVIKNPVTVDQEIVYGHTGIILTANPDEFQFTVKAALLEYAAPTDVILNWTPANITAAYPPGTATETALSSITNTTLNCMGFRVKGTIGLSNIAAAGVSGTMYAQMSVDGGSWFNIAELFKLFDTNDGVWTELNFDVLLAYGQAAHTYQFRGQVIIDLAEDATRELTGALHIDNIVESGSGTILSNNLQIKWSAKE